MSQCPCLVSLTLLDFVCCGNYDQDVAMASQRSVTQGTKKKKKYLICERTCGVNTKQGFIKGIKDLVVIGPLVSKARWMGNEGAQC